MNGCKSRPIFDTLWLTVFGQRCSRPDMTYQRTWRTPGGFIIFLHCHTFCRTIPTYARNKIRTYHCAGRAKPKDKVAKAGEQGRGIPIGIRGRAPISGEAVAPPPSPRGGWERNSDYDETTSLAIQMRLLQEGELLKCGNSEA
jgi:hypothetical protein